MFSTPIGNPAPRLVSVTFDIAPGSYPDGTHGGLPINLTAITPGAGCGIVVSVNGSFTYYTTMPALPLVVGGLGGPGSNTTITIWTYKYGRRSSNRIVSSWDIT